MPPDKYRLSKRAVAEMDSISQNLSKRSPRAAFEVLNKLMMTFEVIGDNPEIGAVRDDICVGLRIFSPGRPANSFVILYTIKSRVAYITSIVHSATDWDSQDYSPLP